MEIYVVDGWYEYEGSSIICVTTDEKRAREAAQEASEPWHYEKEDENDEEDTVDRYYYDGIMITTWKDEKRISNEVFWRRPR